MSKKTFTLSESDLRTYTKKIRDSGTTYSETAESGFIGTHALSSSAYIRRVWLDFTEVWNDAVTASNMTGARLSIIVTPETGNTGVLDVSAVAWSGITVGDTETEQRYEAGDLGDAFGEAVSISPSGTATLTFDADSTAWNTLAEHRVLVLVPLDEASIGDVVDLYANITSVALTVEYEDTSAKPVLTDVKWSSPSVEQLRASYTDSLTVSWKYSHEAALSQAQYQVQMRSEQSDWATVAEAVSSASSVVITPDKFPDPYADANPFYIRVRCMSSTLVWSDWVQMRAALVFPEAYGLSPAGGEIVLAENSIALKWKARVEYEGTVLTPSAVPSVFDLQYSVNGGEVWNDLTQAYTASVSDGVYTYTAAAGTFPAGVVIWRVRPRVSGHVYDAWAQESFVVKVQASTSSVTCNGLPNPTVSWASSSQIAYQVRFANYDSGAVYGAATSHVIPYIYADGVYPVQVRTQASDGTWSEWTEIEYVTITNEPVVGTITLTAIRSAHAVTLKWIVIKAWEKYILYRNDVPIYVGTAKEFTDIGATGECRYYVRAMQGNYYGQSSVRVVDATPAVDCMYDMTEEKWIPLKYSSAVRTRSYSETVNAVYRYYAGRRYPAAFVDGTRDRQLNVSYCFKTLADADTVYAALGHTVLYKDTQGRRIIGLFGGMAETVTKRFEHALTIVQTDYTEEVRYEA